MFPKFLAICILFGFLFAQESQPTPTEPAIKITLKNMYCHNPKALFKGDRMYFGMLTEYSTTPEDKNYTIGSTAIISTFKKQTEAAPALTFASSPENNQKLMVWSRLYMLRHDSDPSTQHNRLIFTPKALEKDSVMNSKKMDLAILDTFAKDLGELKDGPQPVINSKEDLHAEVPALHQAVDASEKPFPNKDLWFAEIDLTLLYGETWTIKHKVGFHEEEKALKSGTNSLKFMIDGDGFSYELEFEIVVP